MSVINDIQSDASKEMQVQKVMNIEVEFISTNHFNKAPMVEIEELVSSIKEMGLQQPLVVYKRSNHDYVLLGGERRLTAVKHIGLETVSCIIQSKPKDEVEERLSILTLNSQRDEEPEYKKARALEYEELYKIKKDRGEIDKGVHKKDWIGMHMSLSGRQITRLLDVNETETKVTTEQEADNPLTQERKQKKKDPMKELKKISKALLNLDLELIDEYDYEQRLELNEYLEQIKAELDKLKA